MSQSQYDFKTTEYQNILSEQKLKKDPFIFTNSVIRQQIKNERLFDLIIPLGVHFFVNIIYQPFNVVGTLLQLQVKQTLEIEKEPLNNFKQKEVKKDQSKNNNMLQTMQKNKINIQRQIKHKPFKSSIPIGYKSVFKDLINQGYQSFSKGLISSSLLQLFRSSFRYGIVSPYLYRQNGLDNVVQTAVVSYCALTLCDIVLNCLHMTESRFILQNKYTQLSNYNNLRSFIKNHLKQRRFMLNGWKTHFIRNLFIIPVGLNMSNFLFLLNFFMVYPINTAYKRILCQSSDIGMIPNRYNSVWHAFSSIYKQQGLKGLYRGSIAHGIRQFSLFYIFTKTYSSMLLNQNSQWLMNLNQTDHSN